MEYPKSLPPHTACTTVHAVDKIEPCVVHHVSQKFRFAAMRVAMETNHALLRRCANASLGSPDLTAVLKSVS